MIHYKNVLNRKQKYYLFSTHHINGSPIPQRIFRLRNALETQTPVNIHFMTYIFSNIRFGCEVVSERGMYLDSLTSY